MAAENKKTGPQSLILENRRRLNVTGVEDVLEFDENLVRMRTSQGDLVVRGEELHVENLSVESGDLLLTGTITDLAYDEPMEKRGLLSGWLRG